MSIFLVATPTLAWNVGKNYVKSCLKYMRNKVLYHCHGTDNNSHGVGTILRGSHCQEYVYLLGSYTNASLECGEKLCEILFIVYEE